MEQRAFFDEYYTVSRTERQVYDLVFPGDASGSRGLVLCIHGGGWVEGCKVQYSRVLRQFCDDTGIAAACINYRYLSEDVNFGDELDDIAAALAAIRDKGAEYGVCFDRVLLTGISAGGHLSLLYAYSRKDSSPVRPVCVVSLCGPSDLEDPFYFSEENLIGNNAGPEYFRKIISDGVGFDIDLKDFDAARPALKKYSAVNYVDAETVPTVFGHGENDLVVPYGNALELDEKLTACGVEHTFISFPDSGHACEDKESMSEIMKLFFECSEKYLK